MKIAHINYILAKELVGVEKKIQQQAQAAPPNFDFLLFNRYISRTIGNVRLVKINHAYNYYSCLFKKFYLIDKAVDLSRYKYLIMRYPLVDQTCKIFLEKYNVISEHHTDEIAELKSNIFKPSPVNIKLVSFVRLLLERKYGQYYRKKVKAIISVTEELIRKQTKGINSKIPHTSISNGIDVESIKRTGFKKPEGLALDLIFVASRMSPWHGLERIIESLKRYQGPYLLRLHVIGDINPNNIKVGPYDNIIFHGLKDGSHLDQIFSEMNLAISTVGLYLKDMKEASSLKTREYTARGIPFILAYDDADLLKVDESKKFFLKLPNKNETIQFGSVVKFVETLNDRFEDPTLLSEYMRQYAFDNMDWRLKMEKYKLFCAKLEMESPEA